MLEPPRRLICATWPSTQIAPSRSTQEAIACEIWRTGAGCRVRSPTACWWTLKAPPPTICRMTDLGTPTVLPPDAAERAVRLAAPRGYCAGVDRAVITVEKALDLYGAPVYVRKQIVHNKHVVRKPGVAWRGLRRGARRGARGETVVFSAHGVSPAVHEQAKARA